jgi:CheY-like chemotaxis protein
VAKILVIEDDAFLQQAYLHVLEKEGFTVAQARTGVEALTKAEEFQPDLILLDMLMPEMDGTEFLRQYDVKNKHPNVKVIVFSNLSMQDKINEMIELGATNYKTKAFFSPREMIELIRQTLAS